MHSNYLRNNAEHCLQQAAETPDEPQRQRYFRAANAWRNLAGRKIRLDLVDESPRRAERIDLLA